MLVQELQSVGKAATGPVSLDPEHFRLLLATIVHYQRLIKRYMVRHCKVPNDERTSGVLGVLWHLIV